MYELKKNGKVFTSKSVGIGPSSYEKRIYRAAVSQRFRNTAIKLQSEIGKKIIFNSIILLVAHTVSGSNKSVSVYIMKAS